MKFTIDRPIPDQILESILEEPHKWKTIYSGGEATSEQHWNGVEIWSYLGSRNVKIHRPEKLRVIEFTDDEQERLYQAIIQRREDRLVIEKVKATKQVVNMFNGRHTIYYLLIPFLLISLVGLAIIAFIIAVIVI